MSEHLTTSLRRNWGRRIRSEFLASVAASLGQEPREVETIDLQETTALLARLHEQITAAVDGRIPAARAKWDETQAGDVLHRLGDLRKAGPKEMYLFRKNSDYCGAVKIDLDTLLSHALALVSLNDEDLTACTVEARSGLVLTYYEDRLPAGPERAFEAVIWGPELLPYYVPGDQAV